MIKYEVTVEDDGTQEWRLNGKMHREDGPAYLSHDGWKAWYLNGKLHREGGPAVIGSDGYNAWWLKDERHREDGPAIVYPDGNKEWWLNNKEVTEADVMGHKITVDGKEVTLSAESYKNLKASLST